MKMSEEKKKVFEAYELGDKSEIASALKAYWKVNKVSIASIETARSLFEPSK